MGIDRWHKCFDKVRHETKAAALAALGNHKGMNVYRCCLCDNWHLGHKTRRSRFRSGGPSRAAGGRGR